MTTEIAGGSREIGKRNSTTSKKKHLNLSSLKLLIGLATLALVAIGPKNVADAPYLHLTNTSMTSFWRFTSSLNGILLLLKKTTTNKSMKLFSIHQLRTESYRTMVTLTLMIVSENTKNQRKWGLQTISIVQLASEHNLTWKSLRYLGRHQYSLFSLSVSDSKTTYGTNLTPKLNSLFTTSICLPLWVTQTLSRILLISNLCMISMHSSTTLEHYQAVIMFL